MFRKIALALVTLAVIGGLAFIFMVRSREAGPENEGFDQPAGQEAARKLTELTSFTPSSAPRILEFSQKEVDSYLHFQLSPLYPKGLKQVRVRFLEDSLVARASVNFDDLQSGVRGSKINIVSSLFKGEHDVEASGKILAQNQVGTYDLLGLRLDNNEIPKPLVDLLVKHVLLPRYPAAAPNREFALPYGIQRIECRPGKLLVHQGGAH